MKYFKVVFLTVVALTLLATSAFAEKVYEQNWNGEHNGFDSFYLGGLLVNQQIADDFTLSSDQTIRSAQWVGSSQNLQGYIPSGPTSVGFKIRFFSDDGGKPSLYPFYDNDVLARFEYTGISFAQNSETRDFYYKQDADIPAVSLNSGEKYWISILNKMELPDPRDVGWGWALSTPGTAVWRAGGDGDGSAWRDMNSPQNTAFSLNNALTVTPEPISSALFLLGGGLMALRRYRRKKNEVVA